MVRLLITVFLLTIPTSVDAYALKRVEPTVPYGAMSIEGDPYMMRTYLGDLEDAPDLYELTTEVAITFRVEVSQKASSKAVPFGLILVRQNESDGAVEEIIRHNKPLEEWQATWSHALGLRLLTAPTLEVALTPGTYRIEISTPDNKGAYALLIGEEPDQEDTWVSYADIVRTQLHFGHTPLHALLSVFVYVPIGLMSLGFLWHYRRKRKSI